jgi:hypothetical protein
MAAVGDSRDLIGDDRLVVNQHSGENHSIGQADIQMISKQRATSRSVMQFLHSDVLDRDQGRRGKYRPRETATDRRRVSWDRGRS